ncbi:sugar ABC transporter permease [Asanoa ishikariensis]|uniref:Carbohydrate ABC transporter membrane protein 1, CUT1 family n=1 Tax=Asanoa ishikariensis TaxID=137265 RepID=A0A1H3NBZ8_9ACTN|nr:sugar ABC transporter permease [Asanoa ishikariensis]GIF68744.1 sugar ABC transporter permease [Asanoa ishikariensis]SDY85995.1 carbohydrate ABC transporter membrane protein 1, CUT1 family [Asanoa ishikariensis]
MQRTNRTFYWMVVPAFVLFFVFHTIPVLQGVFYSFTDYAGYGDWSFIGFENYANIFADERIRDSYLFTFQFALLSTVLVNIIALAIAVGLNARIKFRTTLRGIFFLPNVMAILVVGYIFNYLFSYTVPYLGQKLGSATFSTSILANEDLAWLAIVLFAVWNATAFAVILYLAGLQTIPTELYEAASIDGAGSWRKFRQITFPLIAAFFTINMVLSLKNFLNVFDHIIPLTNGGPGTATESISLVIYRGGFQGGDFAYQTANAVVFFIVIVAFSLFQLRILMRREVQA